MHRLISPFSKPNIQFATVMAHHSSANLSYFCLLLDNDQVSQQAIFIINLLVDKFAQPVLCFLSCTIPAALPLSFKSPLPTGCERHLGSRTVLAAHTGLAASLSATSISLLSGSSSRQDHSTSVLYHTHALPTPHQLFLSTTRVQLTVLVC